jgi:tripartite-type tricarboxylate transporter receptor subunit TctC
MRSIAKLGLTLLAGAVAAAAAGNLARAEFPERPIRVIIPFAPGGGSDIVVRTVQQTWDQLAPQPLVVVNMPGAGGIIGNTEAKDSPNDGYTLLSTHQGMSVNQAVGAADFNYQDFEPIAETGIVELVFAVPPDSPYQTLDDVVEAARANPNQITHATNIGSLVHFATLQMASAEGIEFRYVQVGGGGERLPHIMGGHSDTTLLGVSEVMPYYQSGDIRVLAIFSDTRWPTMPDVPTTKELGFDFEPLSVGYWWFAPKGTPADRLEFAAEMLERVYEHPGFQDGMRERGNRPTFVVGEAFREAVARDHESILRLAAEVLPPR